MFRPPDLAERSIAKPLTDRSGCPQNRQIPGYWRVTALSQLWVGPASATGIPSHRNRPTSCWRESKDKVVSAGFNVQLWAFHHDILALPNGHVIVLSNAIRQVMLPGQSASVPALGDVIVDLDTNLQPVWVWNTFVRAPKVKPYPRTPTAEAAQSISLLRRPKARNL